MLQIHNYQNNYPGNNFLEIIAKLKNRSNNTVVFENANIFCWKNTLYPESNYLIFVDIEIDKVVKFLKASNIYGDIFFKLNTGDLKSNYSQKLYDTFEVNIPKGAVLEELKEYTGSKFTQIKYDEETLIRYYLSSHKYHKKIDSTILSELFAREEFQVVSDGKNWVWYIENMEKKEVEICYYNCDLDYLQQFIKQNNNNNTLSFEIDSTHHLFPQIENSLEKYIEYFGSLYQIIEK